MIAGQTKSGKPLKVFLSAAVCIVILVVAQGIFFTGKKPVIEIHTNLAAIGEQTPFRVSASEPRRGLTYLKTELIQGDISATLVEKSYPVGSQFNPWGAREVSDTVEGTAGRQNLPKLQEGTAVIRVTAGRASTWLRHPDPVIHEISLPVRLTPPSLQVTSSQVYITQGGCELVTYRVGKTAVKDGVQAGTWWFPGYSLPGGDTQDRFALFAAPYDMNVPDIRLIAVDDAGNRAKRDFIDRFNAKSFKADTLDISDAFINKVVAVIIELSPEVTDQGSPLENFLTVNRDLRQKNAETVKSTAQKSRPEFFWSQPFKMLPNSKVMATYGENRKYRYRGKIVDRQTHLGYDLASTREAEIPSPNDGIVVFADTLGIYGNTVIIDHGYGLMTISGHLSSISVTENQNVARGDTIGRTGSTGLAGGDHLHYCTLLQGLPVNPIEWSDRHWIRDHIAKKLGSASPLAE